MLGVQQAPRNVAIAEDGVQAMDQLKRRGEYAGTPLPDIVVLDLNIPRKDGRQVLSEIRADDTLKSLPVVILSSSEADSDIARSYELGASCYVTKPLDLQQFENIVRSIEDFWFSVVRLPHRD